MTEDVFKAVQQLQQLSGKYFYSSPYWTDRIDTAISNILHNTSKSGNPRHLVRNMLSDARKKVHRRREICPVKTCDDDSRYSIEAILDFRDKNIETVFQYEDWLERAKLSDKEKIILNLLLSGYEAVEIAQELGISIKQARVQISRVRKHAKACWEADINV